MTRISEKNITKKIPTLEDTVFGGDTENFGGIVRYDIDALATLIQQLNERTSTGASSRVVISLISENVVAGNEIGNHYIYLCTGSCIVTLPTAINNFNKYTVKNELGSDTINTTFSQTVDGSLTVQLLVENQSVDIISNGSNWLII